MHLHVAFSCWLMYWMFFNPTGHRIQFNLWSYNLHRHSRLVFIWKWRWFEMIRGSVVNQRDEYQYILPASSSLSIKVSFWQSRILRLSSTNREISLHINVVDQVKSEKQAALFCSSITICLVFILLSSFLSLPVLPLNRANTYPSAYQLDIQ